MSSLCRKECRRCKQSFEPATTFSRVNSQAGNISLRGCAQHSKGHSLLRKEGEAHQIAGWAAQFGLAADLGVAAAAQTGTGLAGQIALPDRIDLAVQSAAGQIAQAAAGQIAQAAVVRTAQAAAGQIDYSAVEIALAVQAAAGQIAQAAVARTALGCLAGQID